jgi:hypothetical protein
MASTSVRPQHLPAEEYTEWADTTLPRWLYAAWEGTESVIGPVGSPTRPTAAVNRKLDRNMHLYTQLTLLLLFMLSPILVPSLVHVVGMITDSRKRRPNRNDLTWTTKSHASSES